MTLDQALDKIGTRCLVDLNSSVPVTNKVALTEEFYKAARRVARATYFLFTMQSTLTLEENVAEYDTLVSCAKPVFEVAEVYLGGNKLLCYSYKDFLKAYGNFYSASSGTPTMYVELPSSIIRLHAPPNAAAVALSNTFVSGFCSPTEVVYSAETSDTELEGPAEFQDIVIRDCVLMITEDYVSGDRGLKRWQLMQERNTEEIQSWYLKNTSRYRPVRKQATAGEDRLIVGLGDSW